MTSGWGRYGVVKEAVPEPERQFRGAWIASVYNINWPSKPGLAAAVQQAELKGLLDLAAKAKLNAIILQVRPACDTFYASSLEPWSAFLMGSAGKAPGYDPLEFAVREAHVRGLELHAWINPFRAAVGTKPAAGNHVTRKHPEWIRPYGTQQWVDPGEPKARDYTLAVCADLVRRYDIDGLHLDDYFYPYPIKTAAGITPFPDDTTYQTHGAGRPRTEWRRANIDDFVERLYREVKRVKPAVKVGLSPFGIWRPGVPATIEARLDAFEELCGDSKRWLNAGWCDYFSPQLYWRIDPPEQSYTTLLKWWNEQNTTKRHLWPGVATSRINSSDDAGRPASEMIRQVELAPTGQLHWNIGALTANADGIRDKLTAGPYANAALVPASPWLGKTMVEPPVATVVESNAGLRLTWKAQPGVKWWIVQAKQPDGWKVIATLDGKATQFTTATKPARLVLRGCGETGLLGAPVVWGE